MMTPRSIKTCIIIALFSLYFTFAPAAPRADEQSTSDIEIDLQSRGARIKYSWQVRTMIEAISAHRVPARGYAFLFNKGPALTAQFMLGGAPAVGADVSKEILLSTTKDLVGHPEKLSMAVANALWDEGLREYRENYRLYGKWSEQGSLSAVEMQTMDKNRDDSGKILLGKELFSDIHSYKYDKSQWDDTTKALLSKVAALGEISDQFETAMLATELASIVAEARDGLREYPPWQKHLERTAELVAENQLRGPLDDKDPAVGLSRHPVLSPALNAQNPVEMTNSIGMVLVPIPAGEFLMGSPESEEGRSENETQHRVKLTTPFYLGRTEVTQGQWKAVMGTTPWKGDDDVKEGDDYAATYVDWEDAVEFCRKLSEKEGVQYRLPTEAEWEYACRAGTTTAHSFGDDESQLGEYAWYRGNAYDVGEKYAHIVGQKKPNPWGLYDMHGNVYEWCQDRHREYTSGDVTDPAGSGYHRVDRGGSWDYIARYCRSADRPGYAPSDRDSILGFRVLRTSGESSEQPVADVASVQKPLPVAKPVGDPIENSIGMVLVPISAGTFTMGKGKTAHKVTLTQAFELGVYEVTQEQYEKVMGKNPSNFKGPQNPVETVRWDDAVEFCRKLSALPAEKKAGYVYRLPTEAEWEYACRAGTKTTYSFGDSESKAGEYAWYRENSGGFPHPVGGKQPNPWGLYDMYGNVEEWCQDWYGDYPSGSVTDPTGPASGDERLLRGGSFIFPTSYVRPPYRSFFRPAWRDYSVGFRVLRTFVK